MTGKANYKVEGKFHLSKKYLYISLPKHDKTRDD